MLLRGIEQAASTRGDTVPLNGDITDFPFCQQLHLTSRSPIGRYQHLQLVAVGSRDGVDLETLHVMTHGEPLLLLRLHDSQTSGCIEGARASFIIEPDAVGSLWQGVIKHELHLRHDALQLDLTIHFLLSYQQTIGIKKRVSIAPPAT